MLRLWLEDLADAAAGLGARLRRLLSSLLTALAWVTHNLWTLGKLAIAFLLLMIAITAFGEPVVVEPVDVPTELKDRVPTGEALSRRIIDQVAVYGRAVEELKAERDTGTPSRNFDLPEIEIPGFGVSLRQAIVVTRHALGIREYRIAGELFVSDSALPREIARAGCRTGLSDRYLHLRLRSDHGDELFHGAVRLCTDTGTTSAFLAPQIDQLVAQASLDTYSRLSPCGAAAYYFRNWRELKPNGELLDPDMENAERQIGSCLVQSDEREAGYAYYLQGRIRQTARRPEDALDSFDAAKRLHDRQFLLRMRDWTNRALTSLGFSAIPSYLPALHVHWGNSLLDRRSADAEKRRGYILAAISHYQKALNRDKGIALAYSGLGNALGELARIHHDRAFTIAAACVYADGGKEQRFDAELRYNFANLLDGYGELIRSEKEAGRSWNVMDRWREIARNPQVRQYCDGDDPMNRGGGDPPVDSYRAALDLAARYQRKAADLTPDSERYHTALGFAELKLAAAMEGDTADPDGAGERLRHLAVAERALRHALALSRGENFEARRGLAVLREASRDSAGVAAEWQKAADFYREQADRRPDDPWLRFHQGRSLQALDNQQAAVAIFQKLVVASPGFAPAHLELARSLQKLGRGAEALVAYESVLALDAQSLDPADLDAIAKLRK